MATFDDDHIRFEEFNRDGIEIDSVDLRELGLEWPPPTFFRCALDQGAIPRAWEMVERDLTTDDRRQGNANLERRAVYRLAMRRLPAIPSLAAPLVKRERGAPARPSRDAQGRRPDRGVISRLFGRPG